MNRLFALLQSYWLRFKYRNRSYSEYYADLMNKRAKTDPKKAVGGRWDEIGPLQLDFLKRHGLQPQSSLLDYGCGSLRAGIHFIDYLQPGGYTGVDISEELIRYANQLIEEKNWQSKNVTLILNHDLELGYMTRKFDYIIATSVLTHMVWADIEKLLTHIHKIMDANSAFYATFLDNTGNRPVTTDFQNFHYPYQDFVELAKKLNLKLELMTDFDHPRGQKMLQFKLGA